GAVGRCGCRAAQGGWRQIDVDVVDRGVARVARVVDGGAERGLARALVGARGRVSAARDAGLGVRALEGHGHRRVVPPEPVRCRPLSSGSGSSDEVPGGVRSILIRPAVVFAVFPALSLIGSLAERLSPSPLTVLSAGQLPSTPESASEQFQPMITSPAYQPAAF